MSDGDRGPLVLLCASMLVGICAVAVTLAMVFEYGT